MTPRFRPPANADRLQLLFVIVIMLVLMFTIGIVPAVMPQQVSS